MGHGITLTRPELFFQGLGLNSILLQEIRAEECEIFHDIPTIKHHPPLQLVCAPFQPGLL